MQLIPSNSNSNSNSNNNNNNNNDNNNNTNHNEISTTNESSPIKTENEVVKYILTTPLKI